MAIPYRSGETASRPGVYMRIINRGVDVVSTAPVIPSPVPPTPPGYVDGINVAYSGGVVRLTLPKSCTVSHDGAGTVTLSGLTSVTYDDEGNVTIGG